MTDIQQLLKQVQNVVNIGTETVKETRITQDNLQKNLEFTERKIGEHNVNEEAHPDIRERISMIPILPNMPQIDGPSAAENNFEYTWTLSLNSEEFTVSSYKVTTSTGGTFLIPAKGDGTGEFTHTFQGSNGDKVLIAVVAIASNNFSSVTSTKEITITQHSAPDVSKMTHTFPSVITHGKTYTWKISNITDADNDITNITVSSNNHSAVLSQTNNVKQDTPYTLQINDSLLGPGNVIITVTAIDKYGYTNSKTLTLRINQDPNTQGISTTIPTHLRANNTHTCRVSSVTDPDGDTVTYAISASIASITFSKSENIGMNEDIVITTGDIPEGSAYTLTLIFTDQYGGSTTYEINGSINRTPNIDNLVHTVPSIIYPGQRLSFTIAGATDADGETLSYQIDNTNAILKFGKTSGISENESVSLQVEETAVRGNTYTFDIVVKDPSGGQKKSTVSVKINTKPDVSGIARPIGEIILPKKTYTFTEPTATDIDGQTLVYEYTCSNENAQITRQGDQISFTSPTVAQMARGTTCDFTIAVSDGLETSSKSFSLKMNQVPSGTITHTTPATMKGGTANAVTTEFAGASDADGDAVTYRISNINSNLTLSKTTNISANETITVTAKKVSANTKCTFKVTAYDARGEAGSSVTVTVTIQPIMLTKTPTISYPTENSKAPHETGFDAKWSAYESYADLS